MKCGLEKRRKTRHRHQNTKYNQVKATSVSLAHSIRLLLRYYLFSGVRTHTEKGKRNGWGKESRTKLLIVCGFLSFEIH